MLEMLTFGSDVADDAVKAELDSIGVNIENLLMTGNASFSDVFHPCAEYRLVNLVTTPLTHTPPLYWATALNVTGQLPDFFGGNFDVTIGAVPEYALLSTQFLLKKDPIIYGWNGLRQLEQYFSRLLTTEGREYNYTYRSRSEIKQNA